MMGSDHTIILSEIGSWIYYAFDNVLWATHPSVSEMLLKVLTKAFI